jgi:hypothetical protein
VGRTKASHSKSMPLSAPRQRGQAGRRLECAWEDLAILGLKRRELARDDMTRSLKIPGCYVKTQQVCSWWPTGQSQVNGWTGRQSATQQRDTRATDRAVVRVPSQSGETSLNVANCRPENHLVRRLLL